MGDGSAHYTKALGARSWTSPARNHGVSLPALFDGGRRLAWSRRLNVEAPGKYEVSGAGHDAEAARLTPATAVIAVCALARPAPRALHARCGARVRVARTGQREALLTAAAPLFGCLGFFGPWRGRSRLPIAIPFYGFSGSARQWPSRAAAATMQRAKGRSMRQRRQCRAASMRLLELADDAVELLERE
jgi:hypothetical protein